MEKTINVLFFTEKEDNTKGGILGVRDASTFGSIALKERISKEIGYVLDIENFDFNDVQSPLTKDEYDAMIDNISKRNDGEILNYEFYWEYLDVIC